MSSLATSRGASRAAPGRVAVRRDRRKDLAAAALAATYVLSFGLTDGGYYGTAYGELTTLLLATTLLALLAGVRLCMSYAAVATVGALSLLTGWIVASSLWAHADAGIALEIRRSSLYLVALVAAIVVVGARQRLPFLLGLLAAIALIGAIAVGMRAASGTPVDRLYGTLLEEPVGYPNALGVLVAMGVVLAIGLAPGLTGTRARATAATSPFLVLVLGLTGSRGAALALGLGLGALVFLTPRESRLAILRTAGPALAIGGSAWAQWHALGAASLVALATATLAAGWLCAGSTTHFRSRTLLLAAVVVLAGAIVLVVLRPPAASTSYRSDYWRAALAEAAEHPFLGSGAGSFYMTWREHRDVELSVRDAHSLYVETLSELGPLGLALVLVLVGTPLAVAVRRRGEAMTATAGAGFVVFAAHAGVDWDWEMPVVTLAGLALAAVLLAGGAARTESGDPRTGRQR